MPTRPSPQSAAAAQASSALLAEAQPLLALATGLRAVSALHDLDAVRATVQRQMRDFEIRALGRGIASARIALAKSVLAALIDDTAQAMPWGAAAGPLAAAQPVPVAALRPGAALAEGPAQRLLAAARAGATDAALQELLRVVIALGFDARTLPGAAAGSAEIAALRVRLESTAAQRAAREHAPLSAQWQPAVRRGSALVSWLPLWATALALAAALAVTAFVLLLALGAQSDQVYARLASLRPAGSAAPRPAGPARLAGPLAEPLAAHLLAVRDEADRSVVVLPDGALFEPGLAALRPAGLQLLRRVAAALQDQAGRVQVIDHTDGRFARSARYPSDWDLSVDRARAVHEALQRLGLDGARLQLDGRADTEPLPADDPARAIGGDGRVEIALLVGRQ